MNMNKRNSVYKNILQEQYNHVVCSILNVIGPTVHNTSTPGIKVHQKQTEYMYRLSLVE